MLKSRICSDSDSFHSKYGVQTEVVIVRYGELALKSPGVRNWYEKILIKNIAAMLDSRDIPYSLMRREWGRIFIGDYSPRAAEAGCRCLWGSLNLICIYNRTRP
jgi:thiamine biosynthesis protein ThiI